MQIVDNSPELDMSKPETAALLEGKPIEETKDVKPEVKVSSTSTPEVTKEEEPVDYEAQIRGLKAELSRRQGNADKVRELELELARVQGESKSTKGDPIQEAIQALDDKSLIEKQTDWEDELAAARAKYERAEETGNESSLQTAGNRIARAKQMLSALKQESVSRGERRFEERSKQQEEISELQAELADMFDTVNETFPDLQNQESELWKAGNEVYKANPALMKRLGAAGEIVAAAMAIAKNPNLTKGTSTSTRKEVLDSIEKGFGKALSAGTSSPNSSRKVDYTQALDSGEGVAKFNQMIEKIKAGG